MWTWSPEESRFGDPVWVVRAQSNASMEGAGGGRGGKGGRVGQATEDIGVVCFEPS